MRDGNCIHESDARQRKTVLKPLGCDMSVYNRQRNHGFLISIDDLNMSKQLGEVYLFDMKIDSNKRGQLSMRRSAENGKQARNIKTKCKERVNSRLEVQI